MANTALPNLTGEWKLIRGESDFGFLPPPRLRLDSIDHQDPHLRIRTRQKDANGDTTVVRDLIVGGPAAEISIHGRARTIRARWDDTSLVLETRSEVSGNPRRILDRLSLDAEAGWLTIERLYEQPGGAVRQRLCLRRQPSAQFPALAVPSR